MSFQCAKELLLTLLRSSQIVAFVILFLLLLFSTAQPIFIREEGIYGVDAQTGAQRPLQHAPHAQANISMCKEITHEILFHGGSLPYSTLPSVLEGGAIIKNAVADDTMDGMMYANTEATHNLPLTAAAAAAAAVVPFHDGAPDKKKNKTHVEIYDVCIAYHYTSSVSLFVSVFSQISTSEKKKKSEQTVHLYNNMNTQINEAENHLDPHRLEYVSIQAKEFFNFHVLESKTLIEMLLGFVSLHAMLIVLTAVGCLTSLFKSSFLCSSKFSPWAALQTYRRHRRASRAAHTTSIDEEGNITITNHHPNHDEQLRRRGGCCGGCCGGSSCCCCCCHLFGGLGGICIFLVSLFVVLTCSFYDETVHTHLWKPRFDKNLRPGNESENEVTTSTLSPPPPPPPPPHLENNAGLFSISSNHNNYNEKMQVLRLQKEEGELTPDNESYKICSYTDGCVTSFERDGFRPTVAPLFDLIKNIALFIFAAELFMCVLGGSRYYVERARQQQQEEDENEAIYNDYNNNNGADHLVTDIVIVNGNNTNNNNTNKEQQQQQQEEAGAGRGRGGNNNNNNNQDNNINHVMNRNAGKRGKAVTTIPPTGEQGTADEREPLIH